MHSTGAVKCLVCGGETVCEFEASDTLHGLPGRFFVNACKECGAGMTLPLVDERELGQYYPPTYYTHGKPCGLAGAVNSFYNWRRMARLRLLKARGTLLELGPGDCSFLLFARARGWEVTGLDPDQAVVETGQREGLRMLQGTAAQLPDRQFDVIVAWHSLEHSVDPRRDMGMLIQRLAPGGKLIVGVPDFGSGWARVFRASWHNLDVPRHRVHFTRKALALLTERSGGRVECARQWLSPHAVIESVKTWLRVPLPDAARSALAYLFTPLCWVLETLGAGDCVSVSIRKV